MKQYLASLLYNILAPMISSHFDHIFKKELKDYLKHQEERSKEHNAYVTEVRTFMRNFQQEATNERDKHKEYMESLDRICNAITNLNESKT